MKRVFCEDWEWINCRRIHTKIVYTPESGRSGTDVETHIFTISEQDLDGYTVSNFATDLAHDGDHVDQYISDEYSGITYTKGVPNAGESMQKAVQLEEDATNFQLEVGKVIGLDAASTNFFTSYAADQDKQIEKRLQQPIAKGHP